MLQLLRRSVLAFGLAALFVPCATHAQVREVVSKQVSVGRSEATLSLEFSDDGALEVSLRNGSVLIDGERVGAFEPGGELDVAWRELLGRAVALEDGPLSQALADWTIPAELAGSLADVAQAMDRALETALEDFDVQVDASDGTVSISIGNERSFLRALLGSADRLGLLPAALEGLDSNVRVHVGEDVDIAEGESVSGNLVVIDGDLVIRGEVAGNVVVIGGTVDLREGSEVSGAVRLADARVLGNRGSVREGVVEIESDADTDAEEGASAARARLRNEIRNEVRREIRVEDRGYDEGDSALMAPFRSVARAAGGLIENLLVVLILALVGAAATMFAGDKVDVISETARRAPGRAAMVGVAGTFLLLPVWILGFIALAISIIGIPVAIAWLPLFPLAAAAAAVVGYLAVARNAGEWLADSHYPWTGWIRKSNPLITMVGGLVGLMALFVAANVLSIVPFFGLVTGLLIAGACIVTFLAVQVGFGAVLLTRAGRRREYWTTYDAHAAWDATMDVDVDDDVGTTRGPGDVGGEEREGA